MSRLYEIKNMNFSTNAFSIELNVDSYKYTDSQETWLAFLVKSLQRENYSAINSQCNRFKLSWTCICTFIAYYSNHKI